MIGAVVAFDVDFARSQFPAFAEPSLEGWAFFENAGGSYACAQTISALTDYYRRTKVQPYAPYPASARAGELMDRSRARWAEALGVGEDEVHFGPSTSANTVVLAQAFGDILGPGDEVLVTNQDHEANTGAFRRMAQRRGATLREWRTDPRTGELDPRALDALLSERTRLVTFPHASNIVGVENDVADLCARAHAAGARVVVDGVSFAPHALVDVGALGPDVYLFSLYKVYSVHQGLMVVRRDLNAALPNQSHFFNDGAIHKRLVPAGPDHAQVAAAGSVLDYVEATAAHHGVGGHDTGGPGLAAACRAVSQLWTGHEQALAAPLLHRLAASAAVRLLGPEPAPGLRGGLHRCPTIAFVPLAREPADVVARLARHRVMASHGHYYAYRVLQGLDVDPERGVVRLSFVHYTTADEVARLLAALDEALGE